MKLDKRIVKLIKFMGLKDLARIQNIKIQREIIIDASEYVVERVVVGFTRIIGHANNVKIEDDYLTVLPKFYTAHEDKEEIVEMDKDKIRDEINERQKNG